jgi:PAS domain S-box-containing protein
MITEEITETLKILVVEDDKGLNRLIQKTLSKEGFETRMVYSGTEAISQCNNPNTLLLMDYYLPDMTGKDIIKSLTDKECYVPFIIITGLGNEEIAVEMMKMGAKDYLVKGPGFIDMLPHVIKQVAKEMEWDKERMSAEDALQESEDKFRSLFDQASDSIFLLSTLKDGLKIEDVNQAVLSMHGYSREELIGKPISYLDDRESIKLIPERVQRLMNGERINFEAIHIRKDGSTFPVEVSAHVIHIGGRPYVLSIDRDITKRKIDENELLKKQIQQNALYTLSSALGQTLNLNKLFSIIFETISSLGLFDLLEKGVIFFIEDKRMKLVYQVGHSQEFIKAHDNMLIGDCLCGNRIFISRTYHNSAEGQKQNYRGIMPLSQCRFCH